MHKKTILYLLLLPAILVTLFSCVPQKRVVSVKKELSMVDSQLRQFDNTLKTLEEQRKKKQEQNEIDSTANARIQKFITRSTATIDSLNASNTILIGSTIVNKDDWNKLVKSLSFSRSSSKQIGDKLIFLTDMVNRNLVIKIDQDIIFEPGQYTVTPAMAGAIGKFFEPPTKEIEQFIKKYPDLPLSIVITAKGYADATSIAPGSSLYKDLKERLRLSSKEPDNKELNKELSRARAEEVIILFKKFTTTQSGDHLSNIIYLFEGKGEALPDPKTPDYRIDDRRRRIVLLFWSVFPE